MATGSPSILPAQWQATLSGLPARLGAWWLRELLALFPARIAEWLTESRAKRLILAVEGDDVVFRMESETGRPHATQRVSRGDHGPDGIDDFLRSQGLAGKDVTIGLQLAPERVFHRALKLPIEASHALDSLVAEDLMARTPFRPEDIHHDYTASQEAGRIAVRQWVVRRDFVAATAHALGVEAQDLAFVCAEGDGDGPSPFVRLDTERNGGSRWVRKAAVGLLLGALTLAVVLVGLDWHRQDRLMERLAAEVTATRVKAGAVRAGLDTLAKARGTLASLRARKADEPGLLDVWREVTRLLPDAAWLTELRLAEDGKDRTRTVVLTGFAADAARLVEAIDASPLFAGAALIAPIAVDPREQRERFVLRAAVTGGKRMEGTAP